MSPPLGSQSASTVGRGHSDASSIAAVVVPGAPLAENSATTLMTVLRRRDEAGSFGRAGRRRGGCAQVDGGRAGRRQPGNGEGTTRVVEDDVLRVGSLEQ